MNLMIFAVSWRLITTKARLKITFSAVLKIFYCQKLFSDYGRREFIARNYVNAVCRGKSYRELKLLANKATTTYEELRARLTRTFVFDHENKLLIAHMIPRRPRSYRANVFVSHLSALSFGVFLSI